MLRDIGNLGYIVSRPLCRRLQGWLASESGRLCHGDRGPTGVTVVNIPPPAEDATPVDRRHVM
jgi:hypothetical protein